MASELPLKTIKRIIKEHWDGEITQECCVYVRDVLLDVIHSLAEESIIEFEEFNKRRKLQRLPALKRLDKTAFTSANSIYSQQICNTGKIGQNNKELFCRKKEAVEVV